jgi:hypothetical protein
MDDQGTAGESGRIRFRKLRIAWSVAWGLAAVLLIVLWVRSYTAADYVEQVNGRVISSLLSDVGTIQFTHGDRYPVSVDRTEWDTFPINQSQIASFQWEVSTHDDGAVNDSLNRDGFVLPAQPSVLSPKSFTYRDGIYKSLRVRFPYWLPTIIVCMLAGLPWLIPWRTRFSLRTLLIAITLIGLILGTIIATTR